MLEVLGVSAIAALVDSDGDGDEVAVHPGIVTASFLLEVAGVGGIQLDTILAGVTGAAGEHVQTNGPHKQRALLRVDIVAILFSSFFFYFLPKSETQIAKSESRRGIPRN